MNVFGSFGELVESFCELLKKELLEAFERNVCEPLKRSFPGAFERCLELLGAFEKELLWSVRM